MSEPEGAEEITILLRASGAGANDTSTRLYKAVETELRKLARSLRAGRPADPAMQTTVLVDEAFVRLLGRGGAAWEDRASFFRIAYGTMRNILADHNRRRRPGSFPEGTVPAVPAPQSPEPARAAEDEELFAEFADALRTLEREDPDAAAVLLLCFFGTIETEAAITPQELRSFTGERRPLAELAAARGKSVTATHRTLARAIAFLQNRLADHR